MRKTAIVIAAIMIIFVFFLAVAQIVNDGAAKKTADKILALPLPENTECIESVYKAGKLVGNGNGMQYFGAVLLKSECSLEELKKLLFRFCGK